MAQSNQSEPASQFGGADNHSTLVWVFLWFIAGGAFAVFIAAQRGVSPVYILPLESILWSIHALVLVFVVSFLSR